LTSTAEEKQEVGLTKDEVRDIRQTADDDVFFFGTVICGHKDLIFEDHAPLMYMAAGCPGKLLALLRSESWDSDVIRTIKRECTRHGIDLWAEDAEARLAERLRVVDIRVFRGSGKSSSLTHAVRLWKMCKEPNLSAVLITNTDPKAIDFCRQIRATILSPLFGAIYPDRVPADPKAALTESRLTVGGRTVPDKEPSLMVFGYKASPTGYHFDELHFDDLVGRENRSMVELAAVRDFLSNVAPLYNPGIRYQIRRIHVGTRWDEQDDAEAIQRYSQCFSVSIPIWRRDRPSDDLRTPGVPTMPKWKDLAAIQELQEEILSNTDEGPLSWRCNCELDPTLAGGRILAAEMVDKQEWTPYRDAVVTKGREWLQRPQYDLKGERLPKDRAMDPETLYKVMACDQSFAESGDEWSVVCVGMDQYSHRYVLEVRTGNGVEAMLDAMDMMRLLWKPRRIGMEKIAAQHVIDLVLKLGEKYQRLRPLIEPVPHNNVAKEYRIRNYVAEVMKMRRLWLHPRDAETKQEMKKYKPGQRAKDNRLDGLAMCEVLIQKSMAQKDGEESYKKKFEAVNRRNASRMHAYGVR